MYFSFTFKMRSSKVLQTVTHVCVNELLSDQDYFFSKLARKSSNDKLLESKTDPQYDCVLLPYKKKEVVTCLDSLYQEYIAKHSSKITTQNGKETKLNFVFMGDSRMRQQFLNFLRVS